MYILSCYVYCIHIMLCYVYYMLCYVYYVMLCYVMLCYVISCYKLCIYVKICKLLNWQSIIKLNFARVHRSAILFKLFLLYPVISEIRDRQKEPVPAPGDLAMISGRV